MTGNIAEFKKVNYKLIFKIILFTKVNLKDIDKYNSVKDLCFSK